MPRLAALVLLLLSAVPLLSVAYHAVKVRASRPEGEDKDKEKERYQFFLVHRGTKRAVPDEQTLRTLGFDEAEEISHKALREYHAGPPVEHLVQRDGSPDEIMRVELARNKILQGRLLSNISYLGELINPAVTPFCGRLLLAVGLAWGFNEGKEATEHLEFRWLNHSLAPFHSHKPYFGVGTTLNPLDVPIIGQDPRMVVSGDTLFLAFTYRFSKPTSMGLAQLFCNRSSHAINVTSKDVTLAFHQEPYSNQKNWSPFLYRDELLLVQRVNPLTVVRPRRPPGAQPFAEIVSSSERLSLPWKHGELRGGTNAVSLGDRYLALFHSSAHLPGNGYTTYFFGAYTFTNKPPFRLLAVSPLPIMDESLYTGPWDPLKNRRIDYVSFPSTAFLRGDEIVFSFGSQDYKGMIATMKIKQLLLSLTPVDDLYSTNRTESAVEGGGSAKKGKT